MYLDMDDLGLVGYLFMCSLFKDCLKSIVCSGYREYTICLTLIFSCAYLSLNTAIRKSEVNLLDILLGILTSIT